ncbi:MAG: hypothetical protein PF638_09280 [Candidatus Delongbacteria bacterium]|nr:hypothetical protein [Candidatus Delongbacteria bacterium]
MSSSKEEIIEIVDLLAQNEQALADMYYAYGEKFPNYKLWNILHEEEEKHNDLVLSILDNIEEGSIQFDDMHFSVRTLTIAINQVLEEIAIVEEGGRNLEKAIEVALKIESSMLEKNFLNYFSSQEPEIQKVLGELRKDTKSHKKMLKTAQDKFLKEKHKNK